MVEPGISSSSFKEGGEGKVRIPILKFTTPSTPLSSAELAKELPFSEDAGPAPWDTPSLAVKRKIRQKAKEVAKKKAKEKAASWAKKALDWKSWKTP